MRALQRLRIPTLLFVNKIDRRGAEAVACSTRSGQAHRGAVRDDGRGRRGSAPQRGKVGPRAMPASGHAWSRPSPSTTTRSCATYVDDETTVSWQRLHAVLAAQTAARAECIRSSSARRITGAGVDDLMGGIAQFLPARSRDADGPVSGSVFKIERGAAGERIAYVRMFSGTVHTRTASNSAGREGKVTAIRVFDDGRGVQRGAVSAGEIAKLWGLAEIQIGDSDRRRRMPRRWRTISAADAGDGRRPVADGDRHRAPRRARPAGGAGPADRRPPGRRPPGDLRLALRRGAEGGHPGDARPRLRHRGRGSARRRRSTSSASRHRDRSHAQTNVTAELARARTRSPPRSGCASSPRRSARGSSSGSTSMFACVPIYIYKGVDGFVDHMAQYVRETLQEGLCGWQVTDCTVTMTDCGYTARPAEEPHGGRLPQADAVGPHAGARAGRDDRLRADAARRPRDSRRSDRRGRRYPGEARRGGRDAVGEERARRHGHGLVRGGDA